MSSGSEDEMKENQFSIDDAICVGETALAICVEAQSIDGMAWVPKSQVHDDSEVYSEDDEGTLIVTAWFAEKQGWL
jgi:hypothetical protein